MIGKPEEDLTAEKVPFEVGIAEFDELTKSQISGEHVGLLKILFHRETRELLGVHVIGSTATEIIHIGQMLISFGGKIDYFCDTIFNHPTNAEAYKVAAFDGINRLCLEGRESCVDVKPAAVPVDLLPHLESSASVQLSGGI